VTALIEFDQLGDLKGGAISIYQYKGGKLEYVETLGGSAIDLAKAEVKEAVAAVKEAGRLWQGSERTAVGKDAAEGKGAEINDAGKDAVKAGAEAVKRRGRSHQGSSREEVTFKSR
jgi:branched-chain amino acid transport system substrate-binding protein